MSIRSQQYSILFLSICFLIVTDRVEAVDFENKKNFATSFLLEKDNVEEAPAEMNTKPAIIEKVVETKPFKILSLGLVADARDDVKFLSHVKTAIRTAAHYNLDISAILAIGFETEQDILKRTGLFYRKAELFALHILNGKLYPAKDIPEKYKIKNSPAWFLNTDEGIIIIEGKEEIWKFINAKGEYVETKVSPLISNQKKSK